MLTWGKWHHLTLAVAFDFRSLPHLQAAAALPLQQFKQVLARPDLDEASTEELSQLQRSMAFYCKRADSRAGSQDDARCELELQLALQLLLQSEGLHSALKAVVPSFKHTAPATANSPNAASSISTGPSTDKTRYSLLLSLLDMMLLVRGTGAVPVRPEGTCLPLLKRLFKGITSFCHLPLVSCQRSRPLMLHCTCSHAVHE